MIDGDRTVRALGDLVEAVAAYQAEPSDETKATALARASTLHQVRTTPTRPDVGREAIIGATVLFARSNAYMGELQVQLEMMRLSDGERFRAFTADLGKADPDLSAFIWFAAAARPSVSSVPMMISLQQTLRSQIELYALQHTTRADLRNGWGALLHTTDADGRPDPTGRFGPYLARAPINTFTGGDTITMVDGPRIALGGHAGCDYICHASTGKIWAIDGSGKLVGETADVVIDARPASARRTATTKPVAIAH